MSMYTCTSMSCYFINFSYKLAPTFFSQRENRTMYSLKQLSTTLFQVTFAIIFIASPCFLSSLPYLSKTAVVYGVSSLISLIYSTFFLQSLLCFIGPADHSSCLIPCRLTFTRNLTTKRHNRSNHDLSARHASSSSGAATSGGGSGGTGKRRHCRHSSHPRMSTSSYFASSYFSQIFTGSTYFDSEYGGLNDPVSIVSRRRESSRSHQTSHTVKRNSLLTGELIELYTPRASLAPHAHNSQANRHYRHASIPRGVPPTPLARPLYVSPSVSPHSQLSIHSQIAARQRSSSPRISRPSRSPSPRSFIPSGPSSTTATVVPTVSSNSCLRPCYSAPRLYVPVHRMQTLTTISNRKASDVLIEEGPMPTTLSTKKSVMIMQRQDALTTSDDLKSTLDTHHPRISAAARRSMLKTATMDANGPVWLKRSNSS
jgi:hypothetical protein